jgi:hypothetical protein
MRSHEKLNQPGPLDLRGKTIPPLVGQVVDLKKYYKADPVVVFCLEAQRLVDAFHSEGRFQSTASRGMQPPGSD